MITFKTNSPKRWTPSAPKRSIPKRSALKRSAPKRSTPKRLTPKRSTPKRSAEQNEITEVIDWTISFEDQLQTFWDDLVGSAKGFESKWLQFLNCIKLWKGKRSILSKWQKIAIDAPNDLCRRSNASGNAAFKKVMKRRVCSFEAEFVGKISAFFREYDKHPDSLLTFIQPFYNLLVPLVCIRADLENLMNKKSSLYALNSLSAVYESVLILNNAQNQKEFDEARISLLSTLPYLYSRYRADQIAYSRYDSIDLKIVRNYITTIFKTLVNRLQWIGQSIPYQSYEDPDILVYLLDRIRERDL